MNKARLLDRLAAEAAAQEHMSLHDPLTGLPNRRHFLRLLTGRLAQGDAVGVVVLDLDGFTDVNDAFGHATGDRLLVEASSRLRSPAPADDAGALAGVRALMTELTALFRVSDLTLEIRATAGMAIAPRHGRDAEELLQRADTALYTAKRHQRDVALYSPEADDAGARPELTARLRHAVEQGDLTVVFQPKVDPAGGRPLGAEALVRWHDSVLGLVPPDRFIPVAEQTGLVRPLTASVLTAALAACATWREGGEPLGVAVNLSARSLTDPDLPGMGDLERAVSVLAELHAAGVRAATSSRGTTSAAPCPRTQSPDGSPPGCRTSSCRRRGRPPACCAERPRRRGRKSFAGVSTRA